MNPNSADKLSSSPQDQNVEERLQIASGQLDAKASPAVVEQIRAVLNKESEAMSELWRRQPLGDSLQDLQVRFLFSWSLARHRVVEEREVRWVERPFRGEKEFTPKASDGISLESVNVWTLDLFPGDPDEGGARLILEGSQEVRDCSSCPSPSTEQSSKQCARCGGLGTVLRELELRGVRRLELSEEEWGHPDLAPLLSHLKIAAIVEEQSTPLDWSQLGAAIEDPDALDKLQQLLEQSRETAKSLSDLSLDKLRLGCPHLSLKKGFQLWRRERLGSGGGAPEAFDSMLQLSFIEQRRGRLSKLFRANVWKPTSEERGAIEQRFVKLGSTSGFTAKDALHLVGRGWVAVDFSFEGQAYRLFYGQSQSYSPMGSPFTDEPEHLLSQARQALSEGRGAHAVDSVFRSVFGSPFFRPSPETLRTVLREMLASAISQEHKVELFQHLEKFAELADQRNPGLSYPVEGLEAELHGARVQLGSGS